MEKGLPVKRKKKGRGQGLRSATRVFDSLGFCSMNPTKEGLVHGPPTRARNIRQAYCFWGLGKSFSWHINISDFWGVMH